MSEEKKAYQSPPSPTPPAAEEPKRPQPFIGLTPDGMFTVMVPVAHVSKALGLGVLEAAKLEFLAIHRNIMANQQKAEGLLSGMANKAKHAIDKVIH